MPVEIAYDMAACQRHLWENMRIRSTGPTGHSSANMFAANLLVGHLDVQRLTEAIQYLTDIHDVLRMRLSGADESPRLIVAASTPPPIAFIDISARPDDAGRTAQLWRGILAAVVGQEFDLVKSSPWCCTVIRLAADKHVVCLCLNHLLVDGPSAQVLMSQLGAIYSGHDIDPRPGSYAQFADRVYPYDSGRFWTSETAAVGYDGAVVEAPTDSAGPQTVAWRSYPVSFNDDVPILTSGAMRRNHWTPYLVHAAAYCAALAKIFDRSSFVVGSSVYRGDLAPTPTSVGCYLDFTYFLYHDAPEASVNDLVVGVKRAFFRGMENLSLKRSIIADIRFAGDVTRVPEEAVLHDVWIRGAFGLDSEFVTPVFGDLDVEVIPRPGGLACRSLTTPYQVWLYSKKLMPGLYLSSADGRSAYVRANMSAYSYNFLQRIMAVYRNVLLAMDDLNNPVRHARDSEDFSC